MNSHDIIEGLQDLTSKISRDQPDWQNFLTIGSECRMVTFCNPFSLRLLLLNDDYRAGLAEFDYIFADGILLSKFTTLLRGVETPRVAFDGNSIALDVLKTASKLSMRIALVGGEPGEAQRSAEILAAEGIVVTYFDHGYQKDDQLESLLSNLMQTDLVIVGMGAPRQEHLLIELKRRGFRGAGITCGAYISQVAKRGVRYYPHWVNKLHLRMFFRLINDPNRLFWRYSIGYLPFYLGVLFWLFGIRA